MKFLELQKSLDERVEQGLYRHRRILNSGQKTQVIIGDESLLNFASNDYLGLASQQAVKGAISSSVDQYGFGSGASHLICGHQKPHQDLEDALAQFVNREAALTFSTGYMANLAILQSLAKKGDVIIADKLNHASLIDGARLSSAESKRYSHCDMTMLEQRLSHSKQNKFVVTDSVFSMDGDLAPLKEIVRLCEKYNAVLIVDDAHGFGVLGETGSGICEALGLTPKEVPVLMATLGKSLGGYGAFVAGEKALIDYLIQFGRSYIYTTAMPAVIASGNLTNLNYLRNNPEILLRLKKNIKYFKSQCYQNNIDLLPSDTAIQPMLVGSNEALLRLNEKLFSDGFLVGAIRPPTVAEDSARLRITVSAEHNQQQIDELVASLAKNK